MVFFNYSTMKMAAKIVYYGPAHAGKTANLRWIHDHTPKEHRGEMVSLDTETDRTLFFDLPPFGDSATIAGFSPRIQLYAVAGQVFYNTTRKLVLKGVDGVVFVADVERSMLAANLESFQNLKENLAEMGLAVDTLPVVLQYNKNDLPSPLSIEELEHALNPDGRFPSFEASALHGEGVFDTLKEITKRTLIALKKRLVKAKNDTPSKPQTLALQDVGELSPPASIDDPLSQEPTDSWSPDEPPTLVLDRPAATDDVAVGASPPAPPTDDAVEGRRDDADRVGELALQMATFQQQLMALYREVVELRARQQAQAWPEKFRSLQARVSRAVEAAPSRSRPGWLNASAEGLRRRLEARDFFLSEETAADLWNALSNKTVVVLEGVPGTGKSRLAELLPSVLLEPHPERAAPYRTATSHQDLTAEDFIGGLTMVSKVIGPSCGPLLDSVLCCHEAPVGFWLVMDEINRCDLDAVLSPLLDALTLPEGTVRHPFMFPERQPEEAHVPIPRSFRILGTLNPLDQGLFEISQALRQRMRFVQIPILDGDDERRMIEARSLAPWFDGAPHRQHDRWREYAREALKQLQGMAARIRQLRSRRPAAQFTPCALGSRPVMDALDGFLVELEQEAGSIEQRWREVMDRQIRNVFLRPLEACGPEALRALVDEVFVDDALEQTRSRLRELLARHQVF